MLHYLLVTNDPDDLWIQVLRQAIGGQSELNIVSSEALGGAVDLKQYDVVVLDAPTINDISELLRQICQSDANTHVVVATNYQTWKRAREIFRLGAHDYLYKTLIHRDLAHELDDLQRRSDR